MQNEEIKQRSWFWLIVLIAIVAGLLFLANYISKHKPTFSTVSTPGLYSVTRFVDGDTIDVDMNGKTETVRFIGVDTPETHKPNAPIQCYGPEAAAYTKQVIGSNKVRLQADSLDTNRDRYGRLLRYVYLPDGTLVEAKTISEGYGFAYLDFPFEKSSEFAGYQQGAKAAGKGLWSACQVKVESNGRQQTNDAQ
jgi:endonuclease YncB( thermonuclease family)